MTTITGHDVEHYVDVDLYEVLHIAAQASTELIDRAYRMRLNQVHPDDAGAASTDAARLVSAAGAILRQPEARARYAPCVPRGEPSTKTRAELARLDVELAAGEADRHRLEEPIAGVPVALVHHDQ